MSIASALLIIVKIWNIEWWVFNDLPGWTSIVLMIFFVLGIQTIFLGVLGEYIARIFDEVRNRPNYIVENVFDAKEGNVKV